MKKTLVVLMVLVLLTSTVLFAEGVKEQKPYIAVVSKGEQHDFWQQVKLGANAAAADYGVDITFEGPPSESDVQIQVEMLNNAMAKNPVAIALAALNTSSVLDQLQQAKSQGIPVIGFDSGVPEAPEGSIWANASTNNYAAAGMAAEKMFEVIKGKIEAASIAKPVKIVVMNQDASGESLLSRGKGFRDTMIKLIDENTSLGKSDIAVIGNTAYIAADSPTKGRKVFIEMIVPASAAMTDATNAAQAMLNKVTSDNVLGIFCSNEATVKGLLAATNDGATLKSNSAFKDVVVIGYDAGAAQKNAVRQQYFLGSITQDPYQIGYKAVELAYKAYKGEPVADVDTGAKFYNYQNMDDADIKGLIYD
ncbi:ABC transporter substrate-binding protein [Sphaerochaeta sp. S2]|uniref:ABC transporter substrate-binding protein n=1 Tax=Sphaerochaeta sp. S2 TaxID=2798868 RepID=UPI0018EA0BF9|nr:ABC transporter substrate-binding protein [Sphaerochaeta sp. S2]MBJ2355990.1 ABC transporter substrate-binding protein [Sphaerochaeta sp. S2]MCK9349036.1 ABC transporter substrate-binding protein [Sphaerochaeta sp.]MDD4302540.1 ABC transporter substrate-binding protein [Sphaerochaeta sp.]